MAAKTWPTPSSAIDALGQPGAAGVPEPDDRHPLPDGGVDRVDDVPAALVAHRAAHPGGVGANAMTGVPSISPRALSTPESSRVWSRRSDAAVEERPQAHLRVAVVDGRRVAVRRT